MRKILATFMALILLVGGMAPLAAQDSGTAMAEGLNTPATWYDERGTAMATVQVTEVEEEWTEHSEYSAPQAGSVYRAVHFTVENVSGGNMIVEPYDFSVIDSTGRNIGRSYVSPAENISKPVFEEDTALAADETAEFVLVFEMYNDVNASLFTWQPESGKLVIVNLGADAADPAAVAAGIDTPVTWTDDRGRPMASVSVTNIEMGWEDYDDYSEPEVGTHFVALHITVTNESGGNLIVKPYDFSLLDSNGTNSGRSWTRAAEGSDVALLEEDTPLAAGESMDTIIVFQLTTDVQPTAMLWQPDGGIITVVLIEGDGSATPVASPVPGEEDAEPVASPAAETQAETSAPSGSNGEVTEVNGEPVVFNDAADEELGEISVVSTTAGWDGYHDSSAPLDGEEYYVVTLSVNMTGERSQQVAPLDFYLVLEDGSEIRSDLILNSDSANPEVMETGQSMEPGDAGMVTIPFLIEEGDAPVQIKWDNGVETVILDLEP